MLSNISFRKVGWLSFRFKLGKDDDVLSYLTSEDTPVKEYRLFEHKFMKDDEIKIKKIWPGHIFIKIDLLKGKIPPKTRDFLKKTPFFARFHSYLRSWKDDPILFSEKHVEKMENKIKSRWSLNPEKSNKKNINFELNDFVSILNGVFRGYEGEVTGIDYENGIATLNVEFFGRITPVKITFNDCKKLNNN